MNTQQLNAGEEVDRLARKYEDQIGLSYSDALRRVAATEPELWHRYASGSEIDPKDKEGGEEFRRRITAYSEHFKISPTEAERRVREHDPLMKKYSTQGGSITMSTENIPLDAGSVVDARAQERVAKGEVKEYGEAMRTVLDADPLLAECYRSGRPYLEASAAHAYQDEETNGPTAKAKLGVLINGARLPSNAPDVPLMLRVANLTPDLVRDAASERLDEIANKLIDTLGLRGMKSERYPETLRQARREHVELVRAAESGILNETALREIFYPWFTERD